jgi:hypothetical protein
VSGSRSPARAKLAIGGDTCLPAAAAAREASSSEGSSCSSAHVSTRQHLSAFASIRQQTSAYVSIRQHTSACDSIADLVQQRMAVLLVSQYEALSY